MESMVGHVSACIHTYTYIYNNAWLYGLSMYVLYILILGSMLCISYMYQQLHIDVYVSTYYISIKNATIFLLYEFSFFRIEYSYD